MTCRKLERAVEAAREAGPSRAGADVAAALGPELAAHAAGCARCRRLLAAEARMLAGLARLKAQPLPLPAGFHARVRRRIEGREQSSNAKSRAPWALLVSVTASAVAIAVLASVGIREARRPDAASASAAAAGAASPPLLWSNDRVDVVMEPAPLQPEGQAMAQLVEYDL